MSIWTDFGFRESPYATDPIPATDEGEQLLVGRAEPLRKLRNYLTSSALHPTIEGDNGVGKTSLVAVAGYQLQKTFESGSTGQALLPLPRAFQLTNSDTAETFSEKVLYAVAASFIENHDLLANRGLSVPNTHEVDQWLNAPVFHTTGGGAQFAGFGADLTRGSEPNTSTGFTSAGFQAAIARWLRECFPSRQSGGFICVIDNLELLETSQVARTLLESMRDSVLDLPGLRWVLCGARGIVRTGASSQRLEGRLAEPMDLLPIADADVSDVVRRRIEVFGIDDDAIAPVGPDGFRHIYDILNRNLRNTLKFCEDFAFWLSENMPTPLTMDSAFSLMEVWLTEQADAYYSQTSLGARAWGVFDGIAGLGGSISPGDYGKFDFNSSFAMRPHIKSLEDANLVQSSVDDTDRRRKTIMMTPRGWLVRYAKSGYKKPHEIK
jgi:hypothetical protein